MDQGDQCWEVGQACGSAVNHASSTGKRVLLSPVCQGHLPWKLGLARRVQAFPQDAGGGVGNSAGGPVRLGASQP